MKKIHDIGILYCHQDDKSVHDDGHGWVSSFNKFLGALLTQITRDKKTDICMINESNIDAHAKDGFKALIVILSNEFLDNQYLTQAATSFYNGLDEKDRMVDGKSRLFKVLKSPIEENNKLLDLDNVIESEFYRIDPKTGDAQEFNRFFGSEAERQFWMKLVDMAYDLYHIIQEKKESPAEESTVNREKTVYLASTGVDMVIQRDIVKRELVRHGYRVLPAHTLPKEEGALRKSIKEDLEQSRLSIHLVGEDYGYKPNGSEHSVVDIQNAVAEEHNFEILKRNEGGEQKVAFNRLIWIPLNMKNVSERQQLFIGDLIANAALFDEAEVLRIPLQELKSIIRTELVASRTNHEETIEEGKKESEKTSVYVIYDQLDQETCQPLLNFLDKKGYKPLQPSFDSNFVDNRYIHQENLRRCDASLIYQGTATEEWVVTKIQDIMKSPGFGREKPLRANALCLKNVEDYNPEFLSKAKAMVITGVNGTFSEETLDPFFSKLREPS